MTHSSTDVSDDHSNGGIATATDELTLLELLTEIGIPEEREGVLIILHNRKKLFCLVNAQKTVSVFRVKYGDEENMFWYYNPTLRQLMTQEGEILLGKEEMSIIEANFDQIKFSIENTPE